MLHEWEWGISLQKNNKLYKQTMYNFILSSLCIFSLINVWSPTKCTLFKKPKLGFFETFKNPYICFGF
jgi:glyoxylate utilization-related uncharacterized protein